jgi:serine/threonine-protein kinase ATR
LSQLQNPGIISSVHPIDVVLNFDIMDPLSPSFDKEGQQLSSIHSSYTIRDSASGLCHLTNILSMLVDICMECATSHHATPAFQDYLVWLLDSFLVAHGLKKRWEANPIFSEPCKSEVMALCAVQALLSTLRTSLPDAILRKGCELLAILIMDLLEDSSRMSEKSVTYIVCSGLLILATVCKRHESTRRSMALHLVPSIRVALDNDVTFLTLGKDFQVRTGKYLNCGLPDTIIESRRIFASHLRRQLAGSDRHRCI